MNMNIGGDNCDRQQEEQNNLIPNRKKCGSFFYDHDHKGTSHTGYVLLRAREL